MEPVRIATRARAGRHIEDGTGLHDETGQLGGAGDGSFNILYAFPVHYN